MTNEDRKKLLKEFGWDDNNCDFGWDNINQSEQQNPAEQKTNIKSDEFILSEDPIDSEFQFRDSTPLSEDEFSLELADEEEIVYDEPCQECDEDVPGKDYPPGFIAIHQNVGKLPPFRAEAFCERVKDKFCKSQEWLDFKKKYPNWNFILQPTREYESYVEIYHDDGKHREEVTSVVVKCFSDTAEVLQDTPDLRRRANEYTLLMLGAPVVSVELTEDHLRFCYEHSFNTLRDAFSRKKHFTLLDSARAQDDNFLFEGMLAHATVILARIRMQNGVPEDGRAHMNAKELYEDGMEKLRKWKRWLNPDAFNEFEDREEEEKESLED
jgi:hypothetical protein